MEFTRRQAMGMAAGVVRQRPHRIAVDDLADRFGLEFLANRRRSPGGGTMRTSSVFTALEFPFPLSMLARRREVFGFAVVEVKIDIFGRGVVENTPSGVAESEERCAVGFYEVAAVLRACPEIV